MNVCKLYAVGSYEHQAKHVAGTLRWNAWAKDEQGPWWRCALDPVRATAVSVLKGNALIMGNGLSP